MSFNLSLNRPHFLAWPRETTLYIAVHGQYISFCIILASFD
jgi:hypothetical protein